MTGILIKDIGYPIFFVDSVPNRSVVQQDRSPLQSFLQAKRHT